MYNPYQTSGNSQPQGSNYYQQMQQQPQPQQQPQAFNQTGQQNSGYSNVQQNMSSSFSNGLQLPPRQLGAFNPNATANGAMNNTGTGAGSFYPQQNINMLPSSAINPTSTAGSNHMPFASSANPQQPQLQGMQPQGTGFYNVPFQQPQIQDNQQTGNQPQQQQLGLQSQLLQQQHPQQPQQTGMQSQLLQQQQPQHTGMQSQVLQQQQPQQTSIQSQLLQPQQAQQYGMQSQPFQQPLLPQQTGFYMQTSQHQTPLEPLKPNATGFVNSFANNGINNDIKIPVRRLPFITSNDQAKFEKLFRSVVPKGSNTISGDNCRAILVKSGLQPSQLARIWSLCDTSKAGELLFPEFALAMYLVNNVLQGDSIPYDLDTKTRNEVSSFVDAINLSIATESSTDLSKPRTPFDQLIGSGLPNLQPQLTGLMPQTSFGMPLQSQLTGGGMLNPQLTGFMPQTSFGMPIQTTGGPQLNPQLAGVTLQTQNTGFIPQTSFGAPLQAQVTGNGLLQRQVTGGYTPGLSQQATGNMISLQPQTTGGFGPVLAPQAIASVPPQQPQNLNGFPSALGSQSTGNILQQQLTGGFTSGLRSQPVGNVLPQQSQATGGLTNYNPPQPVNVPALQNQQTGYLPQSAFNPTMPLTAQKTGFGNNEIYSQSNLGANFTAQNEDSILPEEKSLFYKIFETYDTQKRGLLDSSSAVEIFRKSGLNRTYLEHIWALSDINNSGQLNKQEFALGMHLVYRKLNGFQLPNRLPLSLIPSSTKILDNVKNQLKSVRIEDDKRAATRTDALSYKNNDDEEVLPSFRNRRKVFTTNTNSSSKEKVANSGKAEGLRKEIVEKRERLNAEKSNGPSSLEDDLNQIERLKSKIKALPHLTTVENDSVPVELRNRFDFIISKLRSVLAQITEVDNDIANAKTQLFKLKNPSTLVGTGPNGEITENDSKKAKSRALLKARMDALTGKPSEQSDSYGAEEAKYNQGISKIRYESAKNQEIIGDIRRSISEISATLKSTLSGGQIKTSSSEFEKWEFGVSLESEVRAFINDLQLDVANANQPSYSSSSASTTSKPHSRNFAENSSGAASYSQSGTPDGRTYMSEPSESRISNAKTESVPMNSAHKNVENSESASMDEGEDDEEERQLKEQLEKLKLKRKEEKAKRLADLRRQIEEAEAEDSNEVVEPTITATNSKNIASSQNSVISVPSSSVAAPAAVNNVTSSAVSTNATARNPFFKQDVSASSSFDAKAAENQRRVQRGLDADEDDGWSDDEAEVISKNLNIGEQVDDTGVLHQGITQKENDDTVVPVAPPLPSLSGYTDISANTVHTSSHIGESVSPPIPIAPPLPQVDNRTEVPTDPISPALIAPPLPQVKSDSHFVIPPPPPLPVSQVKIPSQQEITNSAGRNEEANDSDDVLSIPESVASDEGDINIAPSGIPPPPPLPQI